jgi:hypothetical protein
MFQLSWTQLGHDWQVDSEMIWGSASEGRVPTFGVAIREVESDLQLGFG